MTKNTDEKSTGGPGRHGTVRLWPGVTAAILLFTAKFIVPMVLPDALPFTMFGGLVFGVLILVWWVFFSRAPRFERWSAVLMMIVAILAVRPFLHDSIANAGAGMLFAILAVPILTLVLVAWAVISRRFSGGLRRGTMVAAILMAAGAWTLVRTGGINNEGESDFAWRWSRTPEERLLARGDLRPLAVVPDVAEETDAEWPGFRGADRDGVVRGVRIDSDWSASPPVELWRRPVGPGWSSFAVQGARFYTQEQRGDDEVVSCYRLEDGEPVWMHRDAVRFWESNSGAGPRGTPTLSEGRVYTLGATGILNVLDAVDGTVVWSRNAASDTETETPMWGFAGSPLVLDDLVIVAAAGSLIAYDSSDGSLRWSIPAGGDCYSSPHPVILGGVRQILLQNESGVIGVDPSDGALLWEHPWPGNPIVQPARVAGGDILLSVDDRSGLRRIGITRGDAGWNVEERWTSNRLKPYFNDSAFRDGHVYGFDGPFLACIDAETGERAWKGGRYGRGQFVLLEEQGLLLVLSEKGDLALVEADPGQFKELGRLPAIEGKTWNHPVLAGDVLLVRNAQEMAGFRISPAGR